MEGRLAPGNADSSSEKVLAKRTTIVQSKYIFLYFTYLFKFQVTQLEGAQLAGATKLPFQKLYLPLKGYVYFIKNKQMM